MRFKLTGSRHKMLINACEQVLYIYSSNLQPGGNSIGHSVYQYSPQVVIASDIIDVLVMIKNVD